MAVWPSSSLHYVLIATAAIFLLGVRLAYLLLTPYGTRRKRDPTSTCHVAVYLGSGGHTTEMLQLLSALPASRYTPRTYISADGDRFSVAKAIEAEERVHRQTSGEKDAAGSALAPQKFHFITLPRARNVHQAWLSTPVSVLIAFFVSSYLIVLKPTWQSVTRNAGLHPRQASHSALFADLILMNGPGTCVPIVAAVYILRIFGLPSPRLIYVESFARVRSLSLTAKILRYFVDKFVVQWNEAVVRGAHFRGWLV